MGSNENETFADWRRRAQVVASTKSANFIELFRAAGLDPAKHARFADWSSVDFSGCDLRGFDFTGARLHGCRFGGARLTGGAVTGAYQVGQPAPGHANFAQAELGQVIHRPDRDPHARAEMTPVADLTQAADWQEFATLRNWTKPERPNSDAHLPTGAVFQDPPIAFAPQMIVMPAGEFWMGSPDGSGGDQGDVAEPERDEDEGPRHRVTIEHRFALGRYAITFEEYDAYAQVTGAEQPDDEGWGRGRRPVINVNHRDAESYAVWLSDLTGQTYRLPSEAEWDYASRAGTETPFWWGKTVSSDQANFDATRVYGDGVTGQYRQKTVEVEQFDPNPWGLYQMHGNVWEWCADAWHDTYDGAPIDGSVREGNKDVPRVLRGGSWDSDPDFLRAADRGRNRPGVRNGNYGFRLARTLNP